MILPENKEIAFRNMIGAFLLLAFFTVVASVLHYLEVSWIGIALSCLILFILLSLPMKKFGKGFQDNELFQSIWKRMIFVSLLLFFVGLAYELSLSGSGRQQESSSTKIPVVYDNPSLLHQCHKGVTSGHWDISDLCPPQSALSSHGKEIPAHCLSSEWNWYPKNSQLCQFHQITSKEALALFKNRHIYFLGDSTIRFLYHRFNHLLDPKYVPQVTDKRHENFIHSHSSPLNATVEFHWTPFLRNITADLSSTVGSSNKEDSALWILGATLWDTLHDHSLSDYQATLILLENLLQQRTSPSQVYWISPLHVVNHKLNTEEKRNYMTEQAVEMYREAVKKSSLQNALRYIDSKNVTFEREEETVDGVHYTPEIYDVMVQFIGNSFLLDHYRELVKALPSTAAAKPVTKSYTPKPTGSMSNSFYGLITLLVATVMLMTWDNFFGLGWFSLKCISKSYDWNEAYVPLLKKILPHNYREEVEDDEEKRPMLEMNSSLKK